MKKTVRYNATEIFNDWFDNIANEVSEKRKRDNKKKREKLKDVENVSEYDYNLKIKGYIDNRLAKITALTANYEFDITRYSDLSVRKKIEKENKEIKKAISVLESEIKQKDKHFFTFIKKQD